MVIVASFGGTFGAFDHDASAFVEGVDDSGDLLWLCLFIPWSGGSASFHVLDEAHIFFDVPSLPFGGPFEVSKTAPFHGEEVLTGRIQGQ